MEWWNKLLISGVVTGFFALHDEINKQTVFKMAKDYANSVGKPLLNVGCKARFVQESDVNIDVVPRDAPNFVLADVQNLSMFKDKQFGSAFVSHVLEHIDNPDLAISELKRVADKVFVVLPHPLSPNAWLWIGHKWVFINNKFHRTNPIFNNIAYWGIMSFL